MAVDSAVNAQNLITDMLYQVQIMGYHQDRDTGMLVKMM